MHYQFQLQSPELKNVRHQSCDTYPQHMVTIYRKIIAEQGLMTSPNSMHETMTRRAIEEGQNPKLGSISTFVYL